jgi:hypothetical protein
MTKRFSQLCPRCGMLLDPAAGSEHMTCPDRRPLRRMGLPTLHRAGIDSPGTLTGRDDSSVQLAGALVGLPTSGTRRREAYEAIKATGPRGATFEELCEALERSYSHVGPRVRELVHDGHVRDSGRRRRASTGAEQVVWQVVRAG